MHLSRSRPIDAFPPFLRLRVFAPRSEVASCFSSLSLSSAAFCSRERIRWPNRAGEQWCRPALRAQQKRDTHTSVTIMPRRFVLVAVVALVAMAVTLASASAPLDGDLSFDALSSLHAAGTHEGELQSLLWQLEQAEAAHEQTDALLMQITQETEDAQSEQTDAAAADAAEDEAEMSAQEEEDHAELLESTLHSTTLARQHITDWGVTHSAALEFTPGWFDVLERGENNDYCRMVRGTHAGTTRRERAFMRTPCTTRHPTQRIQSPPVPREPPWPRTPRLLRLLDARAHPLCLFVCCHRCVSAGRSPRQALPVVRACRIEAAVLRSWSIPPNEVWRRGAQPVFREELRHQRTMQS